MTAPLYRLEILGPPRLLGADGQVVLGPGIPLALLTYLEVQDRSFNRDHLATLFWPGASRRQALQSLRQSLLRIRNHTHHALIVEENGRLGLSAHALTSDLVEFRSALRDVRVEAGLALWRGMFLEGFRRPGNWELEDWLENTRSGLHRGLVAAVVQGTEARLEAAGAPGADALVHQALRVLGDDESLLVRAVESSAALGRRAEAEALLVRLDAVGAMADLDPLRELVDRTSVTSAQRTLPTPPPPTPPSTLSPPLLEPDRSSGTLPSSEDDETRPTHSRPRWWAAAVLVTLPLALALRVMAVQEDATSAAVSSDQLGQVLVYCDVRATDGVAPQLFRMDLDGTNKHRLSTLTSCDARWLPGAGALLIRAREDAGPWVLRLLHPDPENVIAEWTDVRPVGSEGLTDPQMWGPSVLTGRFAVFSALDSMGNRDVYALDALHGVVRRLTTWEGPDYMPVVDEGRRRVVFVSDRSGDGDLYAVGIDGAGALERLTADPLQDSRPSVHGNTVLFVRGRGEGRQDGNMELVLLDLSTGSESVLTRNDWNDYEPAWSPDGRHICWQSEELGHYESEIWIMDLRSRRTWNATSSRGRDANCRWTPRGDGVVFLSTRTGKPRVYVIALASGPTQDLTLFDQAAEPVTFMPRPRAGGGRR